MFVILALISMLVLGLHAGHDANLTLLRDGNIINYCNSERLTGVRHQGGMLGSHIMRILKECSVGIEDVNYIALTCTQGREVLTMDNFPSAVSIVPNGINSAIDSHYLNVSERGGLIRNSFVSESFLATDSASFRYLDMKSVYPQVHEKYMASGLNGLFKHYICEYISEHPSYTKAYPFLSSKLDDSLSNRCFYPIKMSILGKVIDGYFVSHHMAHACSASSKNPFPYYEPVLVLTSDGGGGITVIC